MNLDLDKIFLILSLVLAKTTGQFFFYFLSVVFFVFVLVDIIIKNKNDYEE